MTTRFSFLSVAVAIMLATASVARAEAPQIKTQAPGFYRLILGDFEITALSDGTFDAPLDKYLQGAKPGEIDKAFGNAFLKPPIEMSVNAFLINTGSKLVLVDAGAGTAFGPTLGHLTASLRAAGYQPEQIDDVLITHMHGDHIGGLITDGKATFPNATLHIDKHETDYWMDEAHAGTAPTETKGSFKLAPVALGPYIAAGKLKPYEGNAEFVPGISAVEAPGHTPGHAFYKIVSQGKTLVLWGDVLHAAAVQFPDPAVTVVWDNDSGLAKHTREKAFAEAAKNGWWVASAHLPFPAFGHLRSEGKGYVFVPAAYSANR